MAGSDAAEERSQLRAKVAVLETEIGRLRAAARRPISGDAQPGERNPAAATNAQYLRLIFESAVEYAIFAADLDGNVTMWNEGARRILGYDEDEIVGRPLDTIFAPEDRASGIPEAEMRRCVAEGRAADERWHLRKDGSRFWASGLMMPLQDDGPVVGYLKILRDLTDERRSRDLLLANEARLRMALAKGRLGSWELDLDDWTLTAFETCKANFGRAPDDAFTYADLLASIHPDDRDHQRAAVAEAIAQGTDLQVEFRVTWPDGSQRWVEVFGQQQAGARRMLFGVSRDITDRKAVEKGLQNTVERQNVMHRETSHRVKNSLQLVANLLQLQAIGSRVPEVRGALNDAVTRVLAVAQVHDRLWRQESSETVELAPFVDDMCTDLQRTAPDCELRCETMPITVATSVAVSLGLVLNELVTNAFKYGRSDGRCAVLVCLGRRADGALRLEVRDHGRGLPDGFELTTASASLGMRLITGMLRQLNGAIEATSAHPGARFVLTVPTENL